MITCYFENGSKDSFRHVVIGAIIIKKGKVLLGKRGTYKGKPISEYGKWDIFGGYLDRDETFAEGIKREVKEEVGLKLKDIHLFRVNDSPSRPMEDRQNVDVIFFASLKKGSLTKSEETLEFKWFDLNKLPKRSEFAFDHLDSIKLYKEYLKKRFTLPVVG